MGSPTDDTVYWICLKPKEIANLFLLQTGHKLSHGFIKRFLRSQGYQYRKMRKDLATGHCNDRQEQFSIIFDLVLMMSIESPILSIDCKKKEQLGNLYRDGKCYCSAPIKVYDHDYQHLAEGKVIPHGIYDMNRNEGYITIGNSHETAQFVKDNLLWWWDYFGIHHYPDAKTLLLLCDAGGANGYRHHVFKKELLELAQLIGLDIIVCHYPPYHSKWNPIEHRLFCHVHRAMQGVVLTDYQIVKDAIAKTSTNTGLNVVVRLNLKHYPIGQKTTKEQLDFDRIQFNKTIPDLSYRIAA